MIDLIDNNSSVPVSSIFTGGDGATEQTAVIINASSSMVGVPAEYEFIKSKYGARRHDRELVKQELYLNNSKIYDIISIQTANGSSVQIFFNITKFYGKL